MRRRNPRRAFIYREPDFSQDRLSAAAKLRGPWFGQLR